MWLKIFVILMMALGEAICIYAEIDIAKNKRIFLDFWIITLAGVPLLIAYYFGQKAFNSMWPVMAASLTSVLLIEPLVIWLMFRDLPSKLSIVSMVLGTTGLIITLFE